MVRATWLKEGHITVRESQRLRRSRGALVVGITLAGSAFAFAGLEQTASAYPKLGPGVAPISRDAAMASGASRAKAEQSVSDAAASSYAREFRTTEPEARHRLGTQAMVVNLDARLQEVLGKRYAQASFDNTTGHWRIAVVGDEADAPLRSFMSSVRLDDEYDVAHVSFSSQNAQDAQDAIAQSLATDLGGPAHVERGVEEIDVLVPDADDVGRAEELAKSATAKMPSPPPIHVRAAPPATFRTQPTIACAFPFCDTIVGGVEWQMDNGNNTIQLCSSGFYVGSVGDPLPLVLTAGHCTFSHANYAAWYTCNNGTAGGTFCNGSAVGQQIPYGYFGTGDAGLLEDTSQRAIYPGYVNWSSGGISTLHSYYTTPPSIGTWVCLNGRANGSSCGPIYSTDVDGIDYGGGHVLYDVVGVSNPMCSIPGDSGGPVTLSTYEAAVGIMSGSNFTTNPGGTYNCPTRNYVEPINRALTAIGGLVLYGG
jgi:hypothetical protein